MPSYAQLLLNGVVSFLAMFLIAKILGKKQIAQLDFVDYIIGISIGSIAAEMAFDTQRPWWHYLVGMAIFAVLDLVFGFLARKSRLCKKLFVGSPLILMEEGKLVYRNLKRSKLSLSEFKSLCREKGYFDLEDIAYCMLETGGKLSVLPKPQKAAATAVDVGVCPLERAKLSKDVVEDGYVVKACLVQLGKDEDWLYGRLGVQNQKEVRRIALATYDEEEDRMRVHYME